MLREEKPLNNYKKKTLFLITIIISIIIIIPSISAEKITIGTPKTTIISPSIEETCTPIITETSITREECINWSIPGINNPFLTEPKCNQIANVTKPHFSTTQQCTRSLLSSEKYYDYGKGYEPINVTIKRVNDGTYNYSMDDGLYKAYFKNNTNKDSAVKFVKNGYYFTYDLSGGQMEWAVQFNKSSATETLGSGAPSNSQDSNLSINGNIMTYQGAYYNTNVTYELQNYMLKETLVLSGLPSFKDYYYLQYGGNIKFNRSLQICTDTQCFTPSGSQDDFETSGRIYFKDSNGTIIFYLKEPTITDANGNTTTGTYKVRGSDAQMNFWLRINKSYLQNATYPVRIDPTISLNGAGQLLDDAWIRYDDPYKDWTGTQNDGLGDNVLHSGSNFTPFYKFRTDNIINANTTLLSATLFVYPWNGYSNDANARINVYNTTNNWSDTNITWNNQPSDSNFLTNFTLHTFGLYSMNVTAGIGSGNNVSFKLVPGESFQYKYLYSKNAPSSNTSKNPHLDITYQYLTNQTITNCTDLDSPGITYFLNNDITNTNFSTCFNILANNTVLDCQGHIISDSGSHTAIGISSYYDFFTLKNCTLDKWYNPFYSASSVYNENFTFINVVINNTGYFGLTQPSSSFSAINVTFYNITNGAIYYNPIGAFSNSYCGLSLTNVTENYLSIVSYHSGNLTIRNWNNNASQIILCNASNDTVIDNVTMAESGIHILNSGTVNVSNSTIKSRGFGIYRASDIYGLVLEDSEFNIKNVNFSSVIGLYVQGLYKRTSITDSSFINNTAAIWLYNDKNVFINNINFTNKNKESYNENYLYSSMGLTNFIMSNSSINNTGKISFSGSSNLTIYNTLLNNVSLGGTSNFNWNQSLATGTRVTGFGSLIGGNYWTNPGANGYSDTCNDEDYNGICDQAYNVTTMTACTAGTNCSQYDVDYYPLSTIRYDPVITINSPSDNNWTNDNTTTINFTMNNLLNNASNCSISINGTIYGYNDSTVNNTATTITFTTELADNTNYSLMINCTDIYSSGNSSRQQLHVDATPPSVNLSPTFNLSTAYANSSLGCNVSFNDLASNFKTINYSFFVNDSEKYINNSESLSSGEVFWTNKFIGNFSRDDNVTCNFTVIDQANNRADIGAFLTISNTLPIPVNVTISPSPATTADNLTCLYNYTDADNDDLILSYYNWTIDGVLLDYHNSTLGSGNLTGAFYMNCSVISFDGYDNSSEYVFSPTILIGDITPPVLSGTMVNSTGGYTTTPYYIYANCTDTQSSIGTGYPKVSFSDPSGTTQGNYTLTHISNDKYGLIYTFGSPGLYTNFTFYCRDAQSNLVVDDTSGVTFISAAPVGAGGSGGGGASRTEKVITIQNITLASFCGDGNCDKDENPLRCDQDCKVNLETSLTCLWHNPKSCIYNRTWFATILLLFIIGSTLYFIYRVESHKEPDWMKKWF